MIVGPLSRFGDTAANAGILAVCEGVLPVGISTMLASVGAAVWRILTQPVQNVKTLMQVEGAAGVGIMVSKVGTDGVGALWEGAFGTMGATWLGHYPWCVLPPDAAHSISMIPPTIQCSWMTFASYPACGEQVCDVQSAECCDSRHVHWWRQANSKCFDRLLRLICLGLRLQLDPCDYNREADFCRDCRLSVRGERKCVAPRPHVAGPLLHTPCGAIHGHAACSA